jgi:hypothetical protein
MKLRARVPCRDIFMHTYENYNFGGTDDDDRLQQQRSATA